MVLAHIPSQQHYPITPPRLVYKEDQHMRCLQLHEQQHGAHLHGLVRYTVVEHPPMPRLGSLMTRSRAGSFLDGASATLRNATMSLICRSAQGHEACSECVPKSAVCAHLPAPNQGAAPKFWCHMCNWPACEQQPQHVCPTANAARCVSEHTLHRGCALQESTQES